MGTYSVLDKQANMPDGITKYIKEKVAGRTSLTAKEILSMLTEMWEKRLLVEIFSTAERSPREYAWDPRRSFTIATMVGSGWDSAHLIISTFINELGRFGVTTFDFTEVGEMSPRCFISNLKRHTTITIKGTFKIEEAFPSETHTCCGRTILDGTLTIFRYSWRSRDIELPQRMKVKKIILEQSNKPSQIFESDEEYRNRPERMKRLGAQRKLKNAADEANATGVLTFKDSYLIPLEIGCTVVWGNSSTPRICRVTGQTTTHVQIRQLGSSRIHKVYSYDLVRIR